MCKACECCECGCYKCAAPYIDEKPPPIKAHGEAPVLNAWRVLEIAGVAELEQMEAENG